MLGLGDSLFCAADYLGPRMFGTCNLAQLVIAMDYLQLRTAGHSQLNAGTRAAFYFVQLISRFRGCLVFSTLHSWSFAAERWDSCSKVFCAADYLGPRMFGMDDLASTLKNQII